MSGTYDNGQNTLALDEDTCWLAMLARDVRFNGKFVYGVRSTGIYCRPICPSRRPRREHVVFFAWPSSAEEAGFRACRRCRPREARLYDPRVDLVQRVCQYIESNPEGRLTLADLSAHVRISPHHLQRTFKQVMGITPRQYMAARRSSALKESLSNGQPVTGALYEAGYGSSSRLYEEASAELGMTPATYRRGGHGMRISYTIADCPLGQLLVAATERGICTVSLGDSDAALEAALVAEYPAAETVRDEAGLGKWVIALLSHLNGQHAQLNLPLDLQATGFQRRVWEQLRKIPYGATRSYGEIARAVGQPKAARAVARACAANPAALVIPCHRAVRGDGGLGGYRWGVERKRALLTQERTATIPSTDLEGSGGARAATGGHRDAAGVVEA